MSSRCVRLILPGGSSSPGSRPNFHYCRLSVPPPPPFFWVGVGGGICSSSSLFFFSVLLISPSLLFFFFLRGGGGGGGGAWSYAGVSFMANLTKLRNSEADETQSNQLSHRPILVLTLTDDIQFIYTILYRGGWCCLDIGTTKQLSVK